MGFPFEEIARFDSWREASDAGYPDDQIWSVTEGDSEMWEIGIFCYGPPQHYVNHLYCVVTAEKHDGETYYEDVVKRDDFEWLKHFIEEYDVDEVDNVLSQYVDYKLRQSKLAVLERMHKDLGWLYDHARDDDERRGVSNVETIVENWHEKQEEEE